MAAIENSDEIVRSIKLFEQKIMKVFTYPFYNDFANGRMNAKEFHDNIYAFNGQLGFTKEELNGVINKNAFAFDRRYETEGSGRKEVFFLKNLSQQEIHHHFLPSGIWLCHSTVLSNIINICKEAMLRDRMGSRLSGVAPAIGKDKLKENTLRKFLEGISFSAMQLNRSDYGDQIFLIFPIHKVLKDGLVLSNYDTVDGWHNREICLRYANAPFPIQKAEDRHNIVNSSKDLLENLGEYDILNKLQILAEGLEYDLKHLDDIDKTHRYLSDNYVEIKKEFYRVGGEVVEEYDKKWNFANKLHEISGQNISRGQGHAIYELMFYDNIPSFLMFYKIFCQPADMVPIREYLQKQEIGIYLSLSPQLTARYRKLFFGCRIFVSGNAFFDLWNYSPFKWIYHLFREYTMNGQNKKEIDRFIRKHTPDFDPGKVSDFKDIGADEYRQLMKVGLEIILSYMNVLSRKITDNKYNSVPVSEAVLILPHHTRVALHANGLLMQFKEVVSFRTIGNSRMSGGASIDDSIQTTIVRQILEQGMGLKPRYTNEQLDSMHGVFFGEYGGKNIKKLMLRKEPSGDITEICAM